LAKALRASKLHPKKVRGGLAMPVTTPEEVAQLWAESLAAGDLEALVELYETDATLVPQPGEVVTGVEVEMAAQTSDVLRRQDDGTWRFVIDNPYGSAHGF
jgi:ketosteroid isomerase-like protein